MISVHTVLDLFFLFSAVLPLVLLRPTVRNRHKPGVKGLIVVILSASAWSFTTVLIRSFTAPVLWWLTANVRMLAVSSLVFGFAVLTIEYTGRIELSRRVVGVVALYPALVQLAVWTNPIHHLFYRPFAAITLGRLVEDNARVLFFVHSVVAFALIFAGLALLLAEVLRSGGIRRKQSLVLLLTPLPPTAVNLLLTVGLLDGFDPTPPAFVVSVFMMTWALVTTDFLDIVPLGRYRAVESMDDPAVTIDPEGNVVDCNPAARDLVDADGSWEGTAVSDFFDPIPELPDRIGAGDIEESELAIETADGDRYFDISCSSIRGASSESVGRLLVLREITLLKERERELRKRERELRQKNETLDEFASVVSHDVATPLGVIENKARLVEMTGDPSHITGVQSASQQIRELIDELRELARQGEQIGDTEPVELSAVSREAWSSVQSGDASLTVAASRSLEADRARLRQLLENLLENAVEHGATRSQLGADDAVEHSSTGPDPRARQDAVEYDAARSGPVDADTAEHGAPDRDGLTVEVGTADGGFYVADDGTGLADTTDETIFEQGYTTGEEHTGLGLAIVRRIVDGHGWTIDVTESESGGARFEIGTDSG